MSVQIKLLSITAPTPDDKMEAQNDDFNLIPQKNKVYNLYTAPANKAAIVKSVRLTNILAQTVAISLYLNRPNAMGHSRRRLLAPKGMTIPQKGSYIDDAEITLEPGDQIQAEAGSDRAIHYIISGVEREVT